MEIGDRTGRGETQPDPPLYDGGLLNEIDLLIELIAAATTTRGHLSQEQIDAILEGEISPRIIHLRGVHGEAES